MPEKNTAQDIQRFSFDSTSVEDLVQNISDNDGEYLSNPEVLEHIDAFVESASEEGVNITEKLEEGKSILMDYVQQEQMSHNIQIGVFGNYAIRVGKLLHIMKVLVRKNFMNWGAWAQVNLPFISSRTRQKYMLIAETENAHEYAFLGVERLAHLIAETNDSDEDNPISTFLSNHRITFEPDQEGGIARFKFDVDFALAVNRIAKADVTIDSSIVRNAMVQKISFDNSLIKALALLQSRGADQEQYLRELTENRGKRPPSNILEGESFKRLTVRYVKNIETVLSDQALLASITPEDIAMLDEKLTALKEKMTAATV